MRDVVTTTVVTIAIATLFWALAHFGGLPKDDKSRGGNVPGYAQYYK